MKAPRKPRVAVQFKAIPRRPGLERQHVRAYSSISALFFEIREGKLEEPKRAMNEVVNFVQGLPNT
jgi:hypothetical protein